MSDGRAYTVTRASDPDRLNAPPGDVLIDKPAFFSSAAMKAETERVMIRLGLRVVELRSARGLTQEQLAELLGSSPRQVQRLEAGEANLDLAKLVELSRALRCAVPDLFSAPKRTTIRRPGRPLK